jgi:predicted Abi (CAAX) family protease
MFHVRYNLKSKGVTMTSETAARADSNYARYWEASFNRPDYYPLGVAPDPAYYRPLGAWLGRLILPLPEERAAVMGAWLELSHAPAAHAALIGRRVRLRWASTVALNARFWGATRSVHFDDGALKSMAGGMVLGERLDGLEHVNPFESLAGAHSNDDLCVRLEGEVTLETAPPDGGAPIIFVTREPAQVSGRFYALVRFLGPAGAGDGYHVRHYDRAAGDFSGPEETLRLPEVAADSTGVRNSTATGIERSPCNVEGWYVYGALDAAGQFVVQALAPRRLLRLVPQATHASVDASMAYLRPKAWREAATKGEASVAMLCGAGVTPEAAQADWHEGDRALLIHLFGGIGGENAEPAAKSPLYWGHFAFGTATVVREPLADELCFELLYHQVYAHNPDGLTAGTMHYSRYSGDRQYGWLGSRPIQDLVIKLDCLTGNFYYMERPIAALDMIVNQLEAMMARYRIADGRGSTSVGALNNCAQDSAQALYAAISSMGRTLRGRGGVAAALAGTPTDARRLEALWEVKRGLQATLTPWGSARDDWEYGTTVLGGAQHDGPLKRVGRAAKSWRTMLPPVAARAMVEVLLKHGASVWALRSFQVGGDDPTIAPYVPNV